MALRLAAPRISTPSVAMREYLASLLPSTVAHATNATNAANAAHAGGAAEKAQDSRRAAPSGSAVLQTSISAITPSRHHRHTASDSVSKDAANRFEGSAPQRRPHRPARGRERAGADRHRHGHGGRG